MANRAFLMLNYSGDPNEPYHSDHVAAAASYCYPVLWWSAFSSTDLVLRTEAWEDDDGNEVPVTFPCPITSLANARHRANARRRFFFSYFPQTVLPIYEQWLTLLDGIDASHISINTGDIWAMSDPEQANRKIATYARAFEPEHPDAWLALLQQVNIAWHSETRQITYQSLGVDKRVLTEAEAEVGYRLRGYQWERAVPWSDD